MIDSALASCLLLPPKSPIKACSLNSRFLRDIRYDMQLDDLLDGATDLNKVGRGQCVANVGSHLISG
jgi:hypothetical protein